MLNLFVRSVLLYLLLLFALRLLGRRTVGEMQSSEIAATVLISNLAVLPMENPNLPLAHGLLPILVITVTELVFSACSLRSGGFRRLFFGKPVILMEHGTLCRKNMALLRYTIDDFYSAMRQEGYFDITELDCAVAETSGKISFLPKTEKKPVPDILISDGKLMRAALKHCGLSRSEVEKILKKQNLTVKTTFLMTADRCRSFHIVPRI